jgi:tight adherence protein C
MDAIATALQDPQFMASIFVAIAVFATILTLTMPMLSTDKLQTRIKSVSTERDKLRKEHMSRLEREKNQGSLRKKPKGFMKQLVDQLNLRKMLEGEGTKDKLKMAGLRGQAPLFAFLFFRFIMPFVFMGVAAFYLFFVNDFNMTQMFRIIAIFGAGFAGFYAPNVFVSNLISRRQESIKRAFPDSLDLLLICVESGMSIEAAFARVGEEIGAQSVEMAEEMSLTTAELSYLQDRSHAYQNLAKRTGLPGVKAVSTSLMQAERYGTPLGTALRVMAQENRDMRMAEAEKKAAALPPKLTVPMIAFFLPVIFVVILGPAVIKIMAL